MPWQYAVWIAITVGYLSYIAVMAAYGIKYKYGPISLARTWLGEAAYIALLLTGADGLHGWKHALLFGLSLVSAVSAIFLFGRRTEVKFGGGTLIFAVLWGAFEVWLLVTGGA